MRSFSTAAVMAVIAVMALSLVNEASASCANACSGHGTCGDFDSCTCYSNWQGADCSLRTCPHHHSWATTSKGDLNFDGDVHDATVYETATKFADSGINYVATQANPGGDWEGWPSTINGLTMDEGHFYMECSNRGTCDRKLALCKCFEGYTGAACQRTTCPEECNGRGVCKSVNQQLPTGVTYSLWDGDMSHSCVCDKGFTGPSCADRSCPVGDDPMTTDQQFETQFIEIQVPWLSGVDNTISGNIHLTYTDKNGETYDTDKIPVANYEGSATGTTAAIAAALNDLPNNQLSGVTVEEGWCQTAIPGTFQIATNTLAFGTKNSATHDPTGTIVRCDLATGTEMNNKFSAQGDGIAPKDNSAVDYTGLTDEDDVICHTLTKYWCNRYKVTFAATPGDHADLIVNLDDVIVAGKTIAGGAVSVVEAPVVDTLRLGTHVATDGIQLTFRGIGESQTLTSTSVSGTIVASTKIIDLSAGTNEGDKYEVDERIVVTCNAVAWGTFTVASQDANTVTVTETIKDCSTNTVTVALNSYVIETNTRLDSVLSVGDRLSVGGFSSIPPTIASFHWSNDRTPPGRMILSGAYYGDDGTGDDITSIGADEVKLYGTGTTENSACSDRGVCDSESGACKCFKGYTGRSCSTQNALST